MLETKTLDYYEFLQISPHADSETIHRVYRFLAARFHPDNPASGDPEKFFLLKAAYDVLSDPDSRAAYDVEHAQHAHEPEQTPLSNSVDFMDQVQGEFAASQFWRCCTIAGVPTPTRLRSVSPRLKSGWASPAIILISRPGI